MQCLQPNSKTYVIRNFMHTKIKDILFHTGTTRYTTQFCESDIPNNKPNKHNPNNQTTASTWVSPLTQSLRSYNWDNANSGVFILTFQPISKNSYSTNFVHFIHHQFVHFIDPEKPVRGLMNNFVHFIHPYMNLWPNVLRLNKRICLKAKTDYNK